MDSSLIVPNAPIYSGTQLAIRGIWEKAYAEYLKGFSKFLIQLKL